MECSMHVEIVHVNLTDRYKYRTMIANLKKIKKNKIKKKKKIEIKLIKI